MSVEVQNTKWVLPNRIGYNKSIYNTFNPSKYSLEKDATDKNISLFPQQKLVRDYMQFNSPYRGILLYHELGSGKSAASIAAAEGYINKKKIIIMTPASLSQNYENELMKISSIGLNLKKSWTCIKIDKKNKSSLKDLEKYAISPSFIKKDGILWIPLYDNDIVDASILIENTKYSSLNIENKDLVNATITHIIRNRYTFINYNGLTAKYIKSLGKSPFDDCFVIIDEIHNFISRIVNGSRLARSIYSFLMNAQNIKLILLSGTPIINSPYEIATLINLIRGPMTTYELTLLKNAPTIDNSKIIEVLKKNKLYEYIDELTPVENGMEVLLLPLNYKRTSDDNISLEKQEWLIKEKNILDNITKVLNKEGFKFSTKVKLNQFYALPNIKDDFNKLFINDDDDDNIDVKNMDLFQRRILGTVSYYKITGSDLFPTVLPLTIRNITMTSHQLTKYIQVRLKEMAMDDNKKRFGRGKNALEDKNSVYRAFSRMVCNFAFPEEINRIFPQDIRGAMRKELSSGDKESSSSSSSSSNEKDKEKDMNKRALVEYEKQLQLAMNKLVDGDYLDIDNLKNMYSPKFAEMVKDIETSPGSVLIYSQFRSIEGLGIFSEILNKRGYREIVVVKEEGLGYIIEDMEVFDKIYDNKRYVVFNSDRAKTNILMNIFNGEFSLLPDTIQAQLPSKTEDRNQLYGKLVKIMMITQSGAEGISLKNVRRVLITEYFWNAVRISQVIGRAVRSNSHKALPLEHQNVGVYVYLMSLNKEQLDKNPTLRKKDNELTTDQHIYEVAMKKDYIINKFMNYLKASSMDCVINSVQNKPLINGYKCYNWAINADDNDFTYTPNIRDDNKIQKHQKLQVLQKNKGTVVSRNGKKYVTINNKLYDYFSYKNAGILLPAI